MVDPNFQKALIDAVMNLSSWFETTFPGEVMKRGLKDAKGGVPLAWNHPWEVTFDKLSITRFDGVHRLNTPTVSDDIMCFELGFSRLEVSGNFHGDPTMVGEGKFTEIFASPAEGQPGNSVKYFLELDGTSFSFSKVEILGSPVVRVETSQPGDFRGRMQGRIPDILSPSLTRNFFLTLNQRLSV